MNAENEDEQEELIKEETAEVNEDKNASINV